MPLFLLAACANNTDFLRQGKNKCRFFKKSVDMSRAFCFFSGKKHYFLLMDEKERNDAGRAAAVPRVLLNTKEAAAAFAVSMSTIRAWKRAGCPVVFIGSARQGRGSRPRFEAAALRAWLEERQTATAAAQ